MEPVGGAFEAALGVEGGAGGGGGVGGALGLLAGGAAGGEDGVLELAEGGDAAVGGEQGRDLAPQGGDGRALAPAAPSPVDELVDPGTGDLQVLGELGLGGPGVDGAELRLAVEAQVEA